MSRDYQLRQGSNSCIHGFWTLFFDKKIDDIQCIAETWHHAGDYPKNIKRIFWLSYQDETKQWRCLAELTNKHHAYFYHSTKQNSGVGLFIHPTKEYLIEKVMGSDDYALYLEETYVVLKEQTYVIVRSTDVMIVKQPTDVAIDIPNE